MGVPLLKKKKELNYRRGTTAHSCSECNYYVPVKDAEKREGRCRIMGLKPGRAYRILPHFICDRHDNSRSLKRLRGW